MFYIIGLGLEDGDMPLRAKEMVNKADEVYIEKYTSPIDFKVKAIELSREEVESEKIVYEAKNSDVVLLVPGDPLSATTHFQLIITCIKNGIPFDIIHSSSIFTAVGETGLHLYKFGKTTTLPKPREHYDPKSYVDVIKQNDSIDAHTLLLIDPELESDEAVEILMNDVGDRKVLLCSKLGTEERFIKFDKLSKLKIKVKKPFCIVIPNPNEIEMEALKLWEEREGGERS